LTSSDAIQSDSSGSTLGLISLAGGIGSEMWRNISAKGSTVSRNGSSPVAISYAMQPSA
jgi:hypothetical protein